MHRDPPHLRARGGADAVADALAERFRHQVGDPRRRTPHGPAVTRAQQAAASRASGGWRPNRDRMRRRAAPALDGIDASRSAFVAPTLLS
jgi:hypothetical protein